MNAETKKILLPELKAVIEALSNKSLIPKMEAYMKNNFNFLGIKAPVRKEFFIKIIKPILKNEKELSFFVAQEFWKLNEREYQYLALEILQLHKKKYGKEDIIFFEELVTSKSWWDTVDCLSSSIIGSYFLLFPETQNSISLKWNKSNNMWLQRTSLLFQLKYKEKTDCELLKNYIHHLKDQNQFFIKKAIGWCLREYSKTNPKWVIEFVNKTQLKPLSKKEALKLIN